MLLFGDEDDETFAAYHHQLDGHVLLVGLGSSGQVGLLDDRESNVKFSRVMQVYAPRTAVKTVDVHPVNRDVFLCCSSKGSCDAFDVRSNGNDDGDVLHPLVTYSGHTKALSSAFYSPVTGATVNTVCYDNKIRLYDVSAGQNGSISPRRAVHHNNQTGRWLTTFKAEWHPRRDDLFFVGSMEQPRRIDAFSSTGDLLCTLRGDNLGSVCSIVKCHPSTDMVVGGNASGRVHVFM